MRTLDYRRNVVQPAHMASAHEKVRATPARIQGARDGLASGASPARRSMSAVGIMGTPTTGVSARGTGKKLEQTLAPAAQLA